MNRNSKSNIPALVLGGGITALGVIRSLSKYEIPTFLATDRKDYVRFSKWANPLSYKLNEVYNSKELAIFLENLDIEKAVVFPCSDSILEALVELPDRFKTRYYSSLPSYETVNILTNKDKFAEILDILLISHPQTFTIRNIKQIEQFKDQVITNFFIKPCNSKEFVEHFHVKAFSVKNVKDAIDKFEKSYKLGLKIMLQEYIPGSSDLHYFVDGFVDSNGEILSLFARKRIRIFPPNYGNSSYCISIPNNELGSTHIILNKLFKYLQYRGIFSAEFKFDKRDKKFKILEINARPWWYIEFASYCGVNTCIQAYNDALKLPVKSINNYKIGVGCMHGYNDFLAIMNNKNTNYSIFSWLKELLLAKGPFFSWNDPLPGMHVIVKFINYFKKEIKRLFFI